MALQIARMTRRGDTATMPSEARLDLMTAEELERFDLPGKSTELVRGRLIVREPPGTYHGVVAAKARQHAITHRGYSEFSPDLVAEILSPDDRPGEVLSKVGDWLDAGVLIVWAIDPIRREARVYRADGSQSLIESAGALDGEAVLPGKGARSGSARRVSVADACGTAAKPVRRWPFMMARSSRTSSDLSSCPIWEGIQ